MATAEVIAIKQLHATERQTEVLAAIDGRLAALDAGQAAILKRLDAAEQARAEKKASK